MFKLLRSPDSSTMVFQKMNFENLNKIFIFSLLNPYIKIVQKE